MNTPRTERVDGPRHYVESIPIIAWAITVRRDDEGIVTFTTATPVTAEPDNFIPGTYDELSIQYPSGKICRGEDLPVSRLEWLAAERARLRKANTPAQPVNTLETDPSNGVSNGSTE